MSARGRKQVKKKNFALPKGSGPDKSKDQYPVNDRRHAANAKARAAQQLKRGNLTKSQYETVVRKANKVLGTSSTTRKKKKK